MSGPSIQQFFPYVPDYMSWSDFNGNLAIHYSEEPIVFSPEDRWQETAQNLSQLGAFATYPVPDPNGFASWQDWAREFTLIINGPSY